MPRPPAGPVRRAARGALLGLLLGSLAPVAALAQAGATEGYRIGPKDVLGLEVYEAPEFNDDLTVSDDGTVALPVHGGEVSVAGLTDVQAAAKLKDALQQCCVNRATVTLRVKEYRFRPISVIGAVAKPGPLGFSGRVFLLEVINGAGGLAANHGDVVHVLRRGGSGLSDQLTVRLADLLFQGDARVNIPIYPADLVNVPPTVELTVFCLGEVQRPGEVTFKSTEPISLVRAIARAGGLTDRAAKRIQIKRRDAAGMVSQLEVDYKAVLAGKIPDPELQAGDILLVKESFF